MTRRFLGLTQLSGEAKKGDDGEVARPGRKNEWKKTCLLESSFIGWKDGWRDRDEDKPDLPYACQPMVCWWGWMAWQCGALLMMDKLELHTHVCKFFRPTLLQFIRVGVGLKGGEGEYSADCCYYFHGYYSSSRGVEERAEKSYICLSLFKLLNISYYAQLWTAIIFGVSTDSAIY